MAVAVSPTTTIEDLLTCSLCLELFKEPKTLTCLHSYCKGCLKELTEKSHKFDAIPCPLCRDETALPEAGVEGLPTNFFIKNLLDVAELKSKNETLLCSNCQDGLKAIVRCVECDEFYCQTCADAHDRLKAYQEHKVVDLKRLLSPGASKEFHPEMKCLPHEIVCKFYCRTCNVLVCRDCTVVDHPPSSHSVANLKDVANQCREKSNEAMAKAEKHMAHVKKIQESYRIKKENLKTSVDKISAEVKERKEYLIQQFIQAIEGRSSEMLSQLEQVVSGHVEQNERDEGQIEADLRRMGNYVLFMRNLLANGNDDEMMNMYEHLARYLDDTSGRNPFWIHANDQAAGKDLVSFHSVNESSEDVLNNSVEHLVNTCLGELVLPKLHAGQFEIAQEKGKVFNVGEDVVVILKSRASNNKLPMLAPADLNLVQAKLLTPKQTVIQAKLQLEDDGTTAVHFTSYIPGRHRLAVQLEGNSVQGSPMSVEMKGEPDYSLGTSLLQELPLHELEKNQKSLCVRTDVVGNIYILAGAAMRVFDAAVKPLYAIDLAEVMKKPWNFTIDGEGRIIISDTVGHKLLVFKTDGTFLHEIGTEGKGPGELNSPLGVTVDSYGDIAVCDAGNRRVQLFKADASYKSGFGDEQDGEIMYPVSIQFNSQGQIILSESSLWFWNYRPLPAGTGKFEATNAVECIKIFNRDGQVLLKFGEPGENRGQFWAPITLAVDHCDQIWVADFTYGSIQVFDEKGIVKEVFASKEKEKGAGWLSTMTTASNGAVLYYRLHFDI